MENLKKIYTDFTDGLNKLDTKEYGEDFNTDYKKYLLEKK